MIENKKDKRKEDDDFFIKSLSVTISQKVSYSGHALAMAGYSMFLSPER
jgi:hypothetical protein